MKKKYICNIKCQRRTCFFYPECREYFYTGTKKEIKEQLTKGCSDYTPMTCSRREQWEMIKKYDNFNRRKGEPMNHIKVSEKNEATSYPYWIIIDPRQNFLTNNQGLHNIAGMITGVWFSREAAQKHLDQRRYFFSKNAKVYCHSGYSSQDWRNAIGE